jgi:hypothetical protein
MALLVLCSVAFAQSPPNQSVIDQPTAKDTKQNSGDQKARPAQQPIIVNVVPTPKTEAERAEEAKDRREKAEIDAKLTEYTGQLSDFTRGLFYATVVLGVATVGLLVLGFFQRGDMKAAIAVAVQANGLASIALNAERRPWLQLTDISPTTDATITREGVSVLLDLTVRNFGNWPAENVSIYLKVFRMKDIEAALSFCEEAKIPASRSEFSYRTIFPRETPNAQRILVCLADKWPEKEAISVLVIAGVIGYRFSISDTLHFTPVTYLMRRKGGDILMAGEKETSIALNEIMIDKTQIGRSPT